MGRFKTERSKELAGLHKAQKMAEAFSKHRGQSLLAKFLDETELGKDLYSAYLSTKEGERTLTLEEFLGHLLKDYDLAFGEVLALSYALGYMDCFQGKSIKELYVPRNLMPVKEESSSGGEEGSKILTDI